MHGDLTAVGYRSIDTALSFMFHVIVDSDIRRKTIKQMMSYYEHSKYFC
jgi:hypothetical protein